LVNNRSIGRLKHDGSPYRVLIIDDSAFIAKQLGKILTSEGFVVADMATNGSQGVQKYMVLREEIDLVTLDITMPGMDGVSALEKILEFDKEANVIMISAVGSEDIVKKCLQMGAKNYIVKPLDRDRVLQRIIPILK